MTATGNGRRRATVAAAVLACTLVLVVAPLLRYRTLWHTWPWQYAGERITWCARDYDRLGPAARTLAEVRALPGEAGVRLVGRHGGRRQLELWAAPSWSTDVGVDRVVPPPDGGPCAMTVWLRTGDDAFVGHGLVGGP